VKKFKAKKKDIKNNLIKVSEYDFPLNIVLYLIIFLDKSAISLETNWKLRMSTAFTWNPVIH